MTTLSLKQKIKDKGLYLYAVQNHCCYDDLQLTLSYRTARKLSLPDMYSVLTGTETEPKCSMCSSLH